MEERGTPAAEILADLDARRARDPDVHGARLFGLTYPTGRDDIEHLTHEVYSRYLFGNALNPFKFVELAALESDVIADVGALVHLPEGGGGAMTSGGTESILMSMLVNRERARARGIERPRIVAPRSAHPAYAKAAHYFDMDFVQVPLADDHRADVDAMAAAIDDETAVVVVSAFSYPHGIVDPVAEVAAVAAELGVGCHVDACIGAFVLPFLERLGHDVPPWDFRVEGVTEMSCDIHKYGFVPKGASVVLHRDSDWFGHQVFLYDQWPSGLYGSPAMAGARPAAPIATAWAVMRYLGLEGYTEIQRELAETTAKVRAAIDAHPDIAVVGDPIGPVLAMRSDTVDLYAVADVLDDRGWNINRNVEPKGLHMMLSPAHRAVVDQLLADLEDALAHHGDSRGVEARYS